MNLGVQYTRPHAHTRYTPKLDVGEKVDTETCHVVVYCEFQEMFLNWAVSISLPSFRETACVFVLRDTKTPKLSLFQHCISIQRRRVTKSPRESVTKLRDIRSLFERAVSVYGSHSAGNERRTVGNVVLFSTINPNYSLVSHHALH
jgi:hypothetical protein